MKEPQSREDTINKKSMGNERSTIDAKDDWSKK